jgi:transcriptional regulator with XRE-family HTH domain
MRLGQTANGKRHPVAAERVKRGLSVRDLAELVGMSTAGLSHLETGRSVPRRSTKRLIELALDTKIDWPTPSRNGTRP